MQSITPGTAGFLIVRLEGSRHRVVDYEPHVGLIDPHSESVSCDKRAMALGHECFLNGVSPRVVEASVVTRRGNARSLQHIGQLIHRPSRGGVDYCKSVVPTKNLDKPSFLLRLVL